MRVTRVFPAAGCVAFLLGSACFAQTTNKLAFSVGGGFSEPVKQSDGRFDTGFNLGAGVVTTSIRTSALWLISDSIIWM
jgi:hypothetical protein